MSITSVSGIPPIEEIDAAIQLSCGIVSQVSRSSPGCSIEAFSDAPRTEINYVVDRNGSSPTGCGFFDIEGRSDGLSQLGSLILRPGSVPLRVFTDAQGSMRMLTYSIDPDYFTEITGINRWTEPMLSRCIDMQSNAIAMMMRNVSREIDLHERGSELAIESMLNLMLVYIGRYFDSGGASAAKLKLASWQIRKIDERLYESSHSWPTLTELGELCRVSAKHLSRAFSASKGIPLGKYAEQIRIERACSMLTEAQLTIGQIADLLGFSSASYFSTAFHRATGVSPREFIHRQ